MSDVSGFLGTRRGSRKAQGGTPNAALAGGGGSPAVWTQTDSNVGLANGSTVTWTSASFGTANANRVMVLVWSSGTTVATGVTIGGVAATKAVEESTEISGFQIWYASVAAGTTGNVVVTAGGTMNNPIAVLGQVVTTTPTPAHTAQSPTNTNPASLNITVPTNGVAVVGYEVAHISDTVTWSSATGDITITRATTMSEAHTTTTGSVTPQATNTSGTTSNHMVIASWGP